MILKVKVNGEIHEVNLGAELEIVAPDAERSRVAAQVAYWGVLTAAADGQVERLEAELDHFRASNLAGLLRKDEKLAEWKAKAVVDGTPQYLYLARGVAEAREEANRARAISTAFIRKCDMLRSLISREVGEQRSAGEIGRTPGEPDPRLDAYRAGRRQRVGAADKEG